jgi:serine/threonine protein kinase
MADCERSGSSQASTAVDGETTVFDERNEPARNTSGIVVSGQKAARERALPRGSRIDRYEVLRCIGSGGMAHVYEAVQSFTGRRVAIKLMHDKLTGRRDFLERMRAEATALSHIRHPNVVEVHDAGLTEEGRFFLVMELLEGETLRDRLLEVAKLPLREALDLGIQIAEGVGAAHARQVIHRDLKPENVFVTEGGVAKVLDLGTAKFVGMGIETAPGPASIIGTAAYMCPERLTGLPADARSDVYSLGLMLYEMIAGFHPLVPDGRWPSHRDIALRQLNYEPRTLRDVPQTVRLAVACAISKKPELRFDSMERLAAALRDLRRDPAACAPARSMPPVEPAALERAENPLPLRIASVVRLDEPQRKTQPQRPKQTRAHTVFGAPLWAVFVGAALGLVASTTAFFLTRACQETTQQGERHGP